MIMGNVIDCIYKTCCCNLSTIICPNDSEDECDIFEERCKLKKNQHTNSLEYEKTNHTVITNEGSADHEIRVGEGEQLSQDHEKKNGNMLIKNGDAKQRKKVKSSIKNNDGKQLEMMVNTIKNKNGKQPEMMVLTYKNIELIGEKYMINTNINNMNTADNSSYCTDSSDIWSKSSIELTNDDDDYNNDSSYSFIENTYI